MVAWKTESLVTIAPDGGVTELRMKMGEDGVGVGREPIAT